MIPRRTPLKPGKPPKRKTPPPICNRGRRKKRFAKAYGSTERVAFVKGLPCAVLRSVRKLDRVCVGPIDNAHVKRDGGVKAGAEFCVPLCRRHHQILDEVFGSAELFGEAYGIDLYAEAARTEQAWQAFQGQPFSDDAPMTNPSNE